MNQKLSYDWGYLCYRELPNYLVGRILTIIESFGLREGQEKSAKQIIEQEIWASFRNTYGPESVEQIPGELLDEIHRVNQEIREIEEQSAKMNNTPVGFGNYKYSITYKKE